MGVSTTEMNSNMWSVLTNSKSADFIINYLFGCFYQNISFTLLLLQLLLLGNDVAESPGPETKVGEVSV
jgi:hypothetical protein